MPDSIGRITIPSVIASGTFPLKTKWPHGRTLKRQYATHRFGSANTKIEQRFWLGNGAERYTFQDDLISPSRRRSLRQFWEDQQGHIGAFTYNVPQEDGSTVAKTVCFENAPLSFDELIAWTRAGLTFVEIPDPASAPSYTVNSTVTRFPDGTLTPALLEQVQEIIPLLKIRVVEAAVPDIFLSDRRVTVGGQLYLPRLLRIGDGEVLVSQSIPSDGGAVPADECSFTFGNADRVLIQVANDTNLTWAKVEFSLFHVGTGIKIDLWAGYVDSWRSDKGPEFTLHASDILSALNLLSPVGSVSRTCWRRLGQDGCPYVIGSNGLDLVHFPAAQDTKCDLGYNTPNGCMAHQSERNYGGIYATPQGVVIFDRSKSAGGALLRATSLIADTIFGESLPEIYHDDEGVPQWGLPVKCKIAAGRDESDYYIALGLIGRGPLGALTAPQMWDSNGDGIPDTFIGSTLDGQPNHGFQVTERGILKPNANATFGLRFGLGPEGSDPSDYFSLGRVAAAVGLGAARGWFTNPADSSPMEEVADGGSAYNKVYASGIAFLEIRRTDEIGIQPSLPGTHELIAMVSKGLSAYTWSGSGSRSLVAGCTDPFWIAVATLLRAIGKFGSDAATQEQYFDVDAAITAAGISSTIVPKLFGSGNEKQFQFKGTIDDRRPTRDWLQLILNNASGGFTFSFGKLRVYCRYNGAAVSAFTAGNMIFQSLSVEPVQPKCERFTVIFQDQEYRFAKNTVEYLDQDHAARFGRIQNPLSGEMELTGSATKSQSARLAAARGREELGGVAQAEQDALRRVSFKTTILALETEAGQVVSITDPDMPGGTGKIRIEGWRLNRDYSIDIVGRSVTNSMYDLTVGPKPADVSALPVPEEGPAGWNPDYETPITGDPLFTDKSFGVRQKYEADAGGQARASIDVYGTPPADLGLHFKVRRELVSGIFAQTAASVSSTTIAFGIGSVPLTPNAYVGRKLSKLANAYDSFATVAIADFTVTGNDADGNFTVTPDPASAGCAAGDLFTLRTKPGAFDATSFTDGDFDNPYNIGGLQVGKNRGNLVLILAGKGAGQSPRTVVDNDAFKVTVAPEWDEIPDDTSVIVLVEAIPQVSLEADFNGGSTDKYLCNIPVDNYARKVVHVEGYTKRGAVEGRIEKAAYRELYLWGAMGTRLVTASTTVGMLSTDRTLKFDTSGVTQPSPTTLNGAIDDVQTTVEIASATGVVNGTVIQRGTERMYIQDGAGTTTLTVVRGWGGTTPAAHADGAGVTLPGALMWSLIDFLLVPNQDFLFSKISTDINYVVIQTSGTDQLPDGATIHVLCDDSADFGTYGIRIPG